MRILFVDDDAAWRHLAAAMLGRLGHEVRSAATMDDALELADEVDLAILDHRLGLERSEDLVAALAKRRPSLKVTVVSAGDPERPKPATLAEWRALLAAMVK